MQAPVLGTPTGTARGVLSQLEDRRLSFRGGNGLPSVNCLYSLDSPSLAQSDVFLDIEGLMQSLG